MDNDKKNLFSKNMISIINNRTKYWNGDIPELLDCEYMKLVNDTFQLYNDLSINDEQTYKYLKGIENVPFGDFKKVRHNKPMKSLQKVYSFLEIQDWLNKVCRDKFEKLKIELKYDGFASRFNIKNNLLITRGDGEIGENISHILPLLNFIKNEDNINLDLYGEIICRNSIFDNTNLTRDNGEKYKSSRNILSGIIGSLSIEKFINNITLDFIEYDNQNITVYTNYSELTEEYFDNIVLKILENGKDYPNDGIVISLVDNEYLELLGYTEQFPRGKVALKFEDECKTSKITNIEIQPGKYNLTPVIHIEPIELDGNIITKVTGHNYKTIIDSNVSIGDSVRVVRKNKVGPQILNYIKTTENTKYIEFNNCPVCNSKLVYHEPFLKCTNEDCDGKLKKKLYSSCKSLGIDELGIPTIEKLLKTNPNINSLYDLLNIQYKDVIILEGFAEKKTQNLLSNIKKIIEKPISEAKFLASLNIPSVSEAISKLIFNELSIDDLINNFNEESLYKIKGIGPEKVKNIKEYINENKDLILKLLSKLNIEKTVDDNTSTVKKSICFSGTFPNGKKYYEEIAIKKGFNISNTVNKNLDYLVSAGVTSTKVNSAKKLNINVLTLDEFLNLIK